MLPQIPRHLIQNVRHILAKKHGINVSTQKLVYLNWKNSKQAYTIKKKSFEIQDKIPCYYFTNEIL